MNEPSPSQPTQLSFTQQMKSFPSAFWVANVIELVERFSFWGIRMIAGLYIVATAEEGGLELTNDDKAIFFGVWALIQCLLPMFTGGYADRYGYRISLMVAFGINIVGYGLMGFADGWWSFMLACCLIGTGTAIFKPPLHGTLAHCVDESNSSVGWGMFYQVVNIGGFIGPLVCGYLRLLEWRYAFFAAAGIIVVNILITALFLKDYSKELGKDAEAKRKGPAEVFAEAMATLKDVRFIVFLAIFSCFYFMFMQLWDQLPIFIDQWVDTNDVAVFMANVTGMQFFQNMAADHGQFNPEWIIQIDSAAIIVFVLLVSYISGKFHPISAMIFGMAVSVAALIFAGSVTTGLMCILAIFVFSFGEMACAPKFSEYVGLMAPPEKKALYMGYSNIPFAVGWTGANLIGGPMYERLADKYRLTRDYLVSQLGFDADAVREMSKSEAMAALTEAAKQPESAVQQMLWQHYNPQVYWYICTGVGLAATLAMVGYHFWLTADAKKRDAAAA